jgi:hypothetical protein
MVLAFHSYQRAMALCAPVAIRDAWARDRRAVEGRALDAVLERNDPRRLLIADAIAYGGTFLGIVVSLWMQWRA